MMKSLYN